MPCITRGCALLRRALERADLEMVRQLVHEGDVTWPRDTLLLATRGVTYNDHDDLDADLDFFNFVYTQGVPDLAHPSDVVDMENLLLFDATEDTLNLPLVKYCVDNRICSADFTGSAVARFVLYQGFTTETLQEVLAAFPGVRLTTGNDLLTAAIKGPNETLQLLLENECELPAEEHLRAWIAFQRLEGNEHAVTRLRSLLPAGRSSAARQRRATLRSARRDIANSTALSHNPARARSQAEELQQINADARDPDISWYDCRVYDYLLLEHVLVRDHLRENPDAVLVVALDTGIARYLDTSTVTEDSLTDVHCNGVDDLLQLNQFGLGAGFLAEPPSFNTASRVYSLEHTGECTAGGARSGMRVYQLRAAQAQDSAKMAKTLSAPL